MIKIVSVTILWIAFTLLSNADVLKNITPSQDKEYVIRLNNGDLISGYVTDNISDPQDGEGIKLQTPLGTAVIFESQISDIRLKEASYRHNHRIFLLPTAEAIGDNYFIGAFEALFLYAGGGVGDWLSVSAGRTIIPGIPSFQQISTINAKVTILKQDFDTLGRKLVLAIGGNLGWANSTNSLYHLYAAGTFKLSRTNLTANVFYKLGENDSYDVSFWNSKIFLSYPNNAWGIGLGLDSKLPTWESVHVIGELWNNDITRPTHTGILLGIRLCNSALSADFGIAVFTQPYFAPFISFVWTPF